MSILTGFRRLLVAAAMTAPMLTLPVAHAQVAIGIGVSVHVAPPALPVYVQPPLPAPGYLWTPGYWAYGPGGYYWVPGTWVQPPVVGVLWTPGYWGFVNGAYLWHGGYWGPHVGFYGGINYGYGYGGVGFAGGYWRGGAYYYNRNVSNVNTTVIHNTYNTTVVNNNVNRTSFNGGTGGTTARPTTGELAAQREQHIAPTTLQAQHERTASTNRALFASTNHGQPSIAATARPGAFKGEGVVAARPATATTTPGANNRSAVNAGANAGTNQRGTTSYAARPQVQNQGQPRGAQQPGQPGQPHPTTEAHEQQQHQGQEHQQRQEQHQKAEPKEHSGGKPGR